MTNGIHVGMLEGVMKSRKTHVQQHFTYRTHGGRRRGAGQKPRGPRASEKHLKRPFVNPRYPLHVTLRVVQEVGSLRRTLAYHAFRLAMATALSHGAFRIVHISLQRTHVHLLVEAETKEALSRGMQGFQIAAARYLNGAISAETGVKRRGKVFADRYHARPLPSPRAVRHALSYVLNNWRRHREDGGVKSKKWTVDPYSSGVNFGGWKELEEASFLYPVPDGFQRFTTSVPQTWLLSTGWAIHGAISVRERPGPTEKRAAA